MTQALPFFRAMPRLHGLFAVTLASALLVLSGCGGGGGGGGTAADGTGGAGGTGGTTNPADPGAPVGTAAVAGKLTYSSVPNGSNGSLQYALAELKPMRGVTVRALDTAGAVLATGTADASGNYSLNVPQPQDVVIEVLAEIKRTGIGPTWNVAVRDNTQGNGLYVVRSAAVAVGATGAQKDVSAALGWSGTAYTGNRQSAPFAILDAVYSAQDKVLGAAPAAAFPALTLYWSVNNLPAVGDRTIGQIGSSSFNQDASTPAIYILGRSNVDTDEFDASVVTHEWGHYYQTVMSRDDSPGGAHSSSDKLDRRLAFSEGWGNAFSGIALGRSTYSDSYGSSQAQGFVENLAAGSAANKGWFSEGSIQYLIWRLHALVGFQPLHAAMTGPLKTTAAVTSIHAFNAAVNSVSPSAGASLSSLMATESINGTPDAFGANETNSGTSGVALPMYRALNLGTPVPNVCVSNSLGADKGGNKLGNYSYVRFTVTTPATYQLRVTGGIDPDFELFGASGRLLRANSSAAGSETQNAALPAGAYVMAVADYQNASASTCLTVSVL